MSGPLVLSDLFFDLMRVRPQERPGVREILGQERGVIPKDFCVRESELAGAGKHPHGNAGPDDAGLSAANL